MSGIGSGPPASELPGKMALLRKTLEHDMDRQDIALPSPLVQVKLDIDGSGRRRIAIPRDELFRIRDIFWKNAYGLPDAWPTRDRLQVVDIGANVGCFALYAFFFSSQLFAGLLHLFLIGSNGGSGIRFYFRDLICGLLPGLIY